MKDITEVRLEEDRIEGPVLVKKGSLRVRQRFFGFPGQVLEGKLCKSDKEYNWIATLKTPYPQGRDPNADMELQEYYDIYLC